MLLYTGMPVLSCETPECGMGLRSLLQDQISIVGTQPLTGITTEDVCLWGRATDQLLRAAAVPGEHFVPMAQHTDRTAPA